MSPDDTLATWLREEDRIMSRVKAGVGPGVISPAQARDRSGLAIMQSLMRGEVHYIPMADVLNFCVVEVGADRAVFQGAPSAQYLNPMGTVHGGWICTVLDSALGSTMLVSLPPDFGYVTSELTVRFVRSLTLKTKRVRAVGTVIGDVARTTTITGKLFGPDGAVYAEATGRFRVFPTGGSALPG
ncbi:PaaI family thioesterase [Variovorax sp. M-6]|uniref:PaaI family thioesterase n=1 Tax=Variovorax sp. M-6 TaxID=3233041 RepID=UPI003F99ADE9